VAGALRRPIYWAGTRGCDAARFASGAVREFLASGRVAAPRMATPGRGQSQGGAEKVKRASAFADRCLLTRFHSQRAILPFCLGHLGPRFRPRQGTVDKHWVPAYSKWYTEYFYNPKQSGFRNPKGLGPVKP